MPDPSGFGVAADLGLGNALSQQVTDATEEERRRRRQGLSLMNSAFSPAVASLFPGMGKGLPTGGLFGAGR